MRKNTTAISLALGVALIISSCAYEEVAWERPRNTNWQKRQITYGKPQLWNKKHLTWRVDPATKIPEYLNPEKLHSAINESFKSWEPAGIFTFAPARVGEPADVEISFSAPPGNVWQRKEGCMGQASFPWSANRGRIYLDPAQWWSTDAFAVLRDPIVKWLPHEIGHVLGLQHSYAHDHTMCVHGPYQKPAAESFARLRRLYAPNTSVFLPGQIFAMETPRPYTPLVLRSAGTVAMEAE